MRRKFIGLAIAAAALSVASVSHANIMDDLERKVNERAGKSNARIEASGGSMVEDLAERVRLNGRMISAIDEGESDPLYGDEELKATIVPERTPANLTDKRIFGLPGRVQPNSMDTAHESQAELSYEAGILQCGDGDQRDYSSLFGGPESYGHYYPELGRLAGELEAIPSFGPIRPKAGPILKDGAVKLRETVKSRDVANAIYQQEKGDYDGSGWEQTAREIDDFVTYQINENNRYVTKRATTGVQRVLNKTLVKVKVRVPDHELQGFSSQPRYKLVSRNAADVLDECRIFWENPNPRRLSAPIYRWQNRN